MFWNISGRSFLFLGILAFLGLMVAIDVLLDYTFVLGGFGCPALGMPGAA